MGIKKGFNKINDYFILKPNIAEMGISKMNVYQIIDIREYAFFFINIYLKT